MKLVDKFGWRGIQVAIRMHAMRIRCNLTQESLAERAAISRNTISKLELSGDMKLSTLTAVSDALRVPMHAWFLPEDEWRKWYEFEREAPDSNRPNLLDDVSQRQSGKCYCGCDACKYCEQLLEPA